MDRLLSVVAVKSEKVPAIRHFNWPNADKLQRMTFFLILPFPYDTTRHRLSTFLFLFLYFPHFSSQKEFVQFHNKYCKFFLDTKRTISHISCQVWKKKRTKPDNGVIRCLPKEKLWTVGLCTEEMRFRVSGDYIFLECNFGEFLVTILTNQEPR